MGKKGAKSRPNTKIGTVRGSRRPGLDEHLAEALLRAYESRAKLFYDQIATSGIDLLIAEIDQIDGGGLSWRYGPAGITESAGERVRSSNTELHQVFAHPEIIASRPHLLAYYRNVAAVSKKGLAQIGIASDPMESRRVVKLSHERAAAACTILNRIISSVIDRRSDFRLQLSRNVILAEIGTEIQGTWANQVGTGAAKSVRELLISFVEHGNLGEAGGGEIRLRNKWVIRFSGEPDVGFFDADGLVQIAIEIKGSLDKAGAQTRYGEAKKTFAKQLEINRRCHTVYLASCYTDAVISQIRSDGTVRDWFNLTSILFDEFERERFLNRLFHMADVPP